MPDCDIIETDENAIKHCDWCGNEYQKTSESINQYSPLCEECQEKVEEFWEANKSRLIASALKGSKILNPDSKGS